MVYSKVETIIIINGGHPSFYTLTSPQPQSYERKKCQPQTKRYNFGIEKYIFPFLCNFMVTIWFIVLLKSIAFLIEEFYVLLAGTCLIGRTYSSIYCLKGVREKYFRWIAEWAPKSATGCLIVSSCKHLIMVIKSWW